MFQIRDYVPFPTEHITVAIYRILLFLTNSPLLFLIPQKNFRLQHDTYIHLTISLIFDLVEPRKKRKNRSPQSKEMSLDFFFMLNLVAGKLFPIDNIFLLKARQDTRADKRDALSLKKSFVSNLMDSLYMYICLYFI